MQLGAANTYRYTARNSRFPADPLAAHPSAVLTSQILDPVFAVLERDPRMLSRHVDVWRQVDIHRFVSASDSKVLPLSGESLRGRFSVFKRDDHGSYYSDVSCKRAYAWSAQMRSSSAAPPT